MRRTALLLVGALALAGNADAKFITRGDDSNVLACDVCERALTDAGSHALAFAPACGAAFDAGMPFRSRAKMPPRIVYL